MFNLLSIYYVSHKPFIKTDDFIIAIFDRICTYFWEHINISVKYLGVLISLDLTSIYKVVQGGKSHGIGTKYVHVN